MSDVDKEQLLLTFAFSDTTTTVQLGWYSGTVASHSLHLPISGPHSVSWQEVKVLKSAAFRIKYGVLSITVEVTTASADCIQVMSPVDCSW